RRRVPREARAALAVALVELWVVRHRRDQRELAALAMQHGAPEFVGVGREGVVRHGRDDDPRRLLELVLELARAPARVPGEAPRADRAELVELGGGRHERDVADD